MDFEKHVVRQIAWSGATFGPGPRTAGVCDHIRKELIEVEESNGSPAEWTDVAILGMDGLWRSIREQNPSLANDEIAELVVESILAKQNRNERRVWPDWRTMPADKAIEHVRS